MPIKRKINKNTREKFLIKWNGLKDFKFVMSPQWWFMPHFSSNKLLITTLNYRFKCFFSPDLIRFLSTQRVIVLKIYCKKLIKMWIHSDCKWLKMWNKNFYCFFASYFRTHLPFHLDLMSIMLVMIAVGTEKQLLTL